jgi:sugar phosphate permease
MSRPNATATRDLRSLLTPSPPNVVLGLLCLLYLLLYVDRVNIATAAPLIRAELGLSNTELGMVFSAFSIPYALLQLFGGYVADRLGARTTLGVCCVLVAVSTMLTGAVGGFASLLVVRLALGAAEGPAFPAATRAISRWTAAEKWAFAQGITHSSARVGNALTPPLVASLIAALSWRASFVILGAVTLVWVAAWLWYFRDDPQRHRGAMDAPQAPLAAAQGRGGGSVPVPYWRLAKRIFPVTVVDFCYGWTLWLFLSWIPSFFFENYALDLRASALFSAGVLFSGVVGDTVGGVASDQLLRRTGSVLVARRAVLIVGFLGAMAFLVPVVLVRDLTVAAVCLSAAFFFAELIVAPIWAVPMDIAPRYAGSASGMMNFGFGLAGLVSPLSFGYLVDLTGSWVVPFVGSILLSLLGAVLAARLRPDRRLADEAET